MLRGYQKEEIPGMGAAMTKCWRIRSSKEDSVRGSHRGGHWSERGQRGREPGRDTKVFRTG